MEHSTLIKLEFDKILARLASLAYSPGGYEKALEVRPATDLNLVKQWLEETDEAMKLLHFGEPLFLNFLQPAKPYLNKARLGGVLGAGELYAIYHLLRASRLGLKYTGEKTTAPLLAKKAAAIVANTELEKLIHNAVDEEGTIKSDASPALKTIRKQIDSNRSQIKDFLQRFIRAESNQSLLQEALITERSGRYVVPVKQEHRYEVKGLVHDESASGATVFIEPMAVVEHNNKIKTLLAEEQREIERILRFLSSEVAGFADELILNLQVLEELDMVFARGKLAYEMNAYRPEVNQKGRVELNRAKHPLLGERAVPVNISLGKNFDILVITGPNTGGKTVVLKTLGLLTLMAMSGLFIPAREKSQVAVFRDIFVDIGDEQDIEQSLSTFSSHMKNIIHILEEINESSLVLLDELGAGTDPHEGAALARAILEEMKDRGARVVVTTHQSELKTFAYQNDRVENACVEFDPITLMPTYELTIGTPGHSNAFEIAYRLGLDQTLVKRARTLLPRREMEIGNMIKQLRESRQQFEQGNQELEQQKRQLDQEKALLDEEQKRFYQEKEETLQKATLEAEAYLREVRRAANEAIEELKELIKDKEKPPKWHELEEKRKKLKELNLEISYERERKVSQEINKGDYVLINRVNQKGYVVDGPNPQGEIVVQSGKMKFNLGRDQVQVIPAPKRERSGYRNQIILDKAQNISPEIDLRGKYAEDALDELEKYLEDANLVGLSRVRIIHGKGTGALRVAVRDYLKSHRYIKDFRDGLLEEGGYGVTVANLK